MSGKTILAGQKALAVATGQPLFDYYKVLAQGRALTIEQGDPAGEATKRPSSRKRPERRNTVVCRIARSVRAPLLCFRAAGHAAWPTAWGLRVEQGVPVPPLHQSSSAVSFEAWLARPLPTTA